MVSEAGVHEVSNRRQTLQVLGATSFAGNHLMNIVFFVLLIPIPLAAAHKSST
jgi:hypothetical protein